MKFRKIDTRDRGLPFLGNAEIYSAQTTHHTYSIVYLPDMELGYSATWRSKTPDARGHLVTQKFTPEFVETFAAAEKQCRDHSRGRRDA